MAGVDRSVMWQFMGHSRARTLLSRSLEAGQLSHAYLFVGPPHVGKLTLALDLARAVNCQADRVPCGECAACRRIAEGNHSDVKIIGREEQHKVITISQVREMDNDASLPPFEGRCKVFIFDGAELLSQDAANRLLKTLEEPPSNVLIILLTSREKDVLPTIISRCQRVELPPLPIDVVRETLTERYMIDDEKAELLARVSGGCLGWAIQATQDGGLLEERDRRLNALAGLVHAGLLERFTYAAELANRFSKSREDVEELLSLWIQWWRDLLILKCGQSGPVTNVDRLSVLSGQAETLSTEQIVGFIRRLQDARKYLEQNANPRLVFEVLMLNMPQEKPS
ncbi:MAG: DNA polymerase III subunit delta' [Chloroflexi bacterium]|nr:MAG: DNA polymerase III subunit delta' [Chloroflexota bacterium]